MIEFVLNINSFSDKHRQHVPWPNSRPARSIVSISIRASSMRFGLNRYKNKTGIAYNVMGEICISTELNSFISPSFGLSHNLVCTNNRQKDATHRFICEYLVKKLYYRNIFVYNENRLRRRLMTANYWISFISVLVLVSCCQFWLSCLPNLFSKRPISAYYY